MDNWELETRTLRIQISQSYNAAPGFHVTHVEYTDYGSGDGAHPAASSPACLRIQATYVPATFDAAATSPRVPTGAPALSVIL